MSRYNKFAVAMAGWIVMAVASVLTDGVITAAEWIQIVIQITTAGGVWAAANVPDLRVAKAVVAGILAAANLAISYITDNAITTYEWLNLVIAGLTAAGVWAVPNSEPQPYVRATGGIPGPPVR